MFKWIDAILRIIGLSDKPPKPPDQLTKIGILTIVFIGCAFLAESQPSLTELQKLKADNFKLKSQVLQCQVSLGNNQLTIEQRQLVNEYRKQLNAKETDIFDWDTLTFKSTPSSESK